MESQEKSIEENMLGDAPIEPKHHHIMNVIAQALDGALNGEAKPGERETGFLLMVFPFNSHEGRCNYVSNVSDRKDVITLLKEQIARFEGMPEAKPTSIN